jgi:altronate dehydratase
MNLEDNCATALKEIPKHIILQNNEYVIMINQVIPLGHKFALKDINEGDLVIKYGESIGIATKNINRGDWIHTHNLTSQYLIEVLKK